MNKSNYCADFLSSKVFRIDPSKIKPIAALVSSSIKFRLPKDGILIDHFKGKKGEFNLTSYFSDKLHSVSLPYLLTVLEFNYNGTPVIVCLRDNNNEPLSKFDGISFKVLFKEKHWSEVSVTCVIDSNFNPFYVADEGEVEVSDNHKNFLSHIAYAVLGFLCALQCSNVVEQEQSAPEKLNKKRKKKGKQPFFSYKILTIDSNSESINKGTDNGGHASPRVHLRRGHIRRLKDKTVWVNPCVVGDKSKGVIHKDYRVA